MKDGRTRLAYKPEHVIDLKTDLILAAEVHRADQSDADTRIDTLAEAQVNLMRSGSDTKLCEVAADKGYHKAKTLVDCSEILGVRTYVPERRSRHQRRWKGKPDGWMQATLTNRRRVRGNTSKLLQRLRSEKAERSFAHSCNRGRLRRTWLRGLDEVAKRWLIGAAAINLGRMMPLLYEVGSARALMGLALRYFLRQVAAWWSATVLIRAFHLLHAWQAAEIGFVAGQTFWR